MVKGVKMIKTKKASSISAEDTTSLNHMFEQMTGIANAEPDVIIPKILRLKESIVKYYKVFNILINCVEFSEWYKEISEFLSRLIESSGVDVSVEYSDKNILQILDLQKIDADKLNESYKSLKNSISLKQIVITCSNLDPFKRYIEDKDNLSDVFIKRERGLEIIPFAFSALELTQLWNCDDLSAAGKKVMLSVLHHTYTIGHVIFDIISSPDIDISKFSHILVESIAGLRKQIPRCDKAFDVIENSVKLLEGNFKNYYRNSIEAENPSVIIENFIVDVSTSQHASPLVTMQFRRIVSFLKQKSAGVQDPKVKKLFSMLNTQFSAMDSELGVKTTEEDTQDTQDTQDALDTSDTLDTSNDQEVKAE